MKSSFRIPARVASFVHTVLLHFVILLIKIIQQAPKTYELKEEKQCPFWIFLIMQGNTHKDQDQQQQGNLSTLFPIICAATVFSVHKQKKRKRNMQQFSSSLLIMYLLLKNFQLFFSSRCTSSIFSCAPLLACFLLPSCLFLSSHPL